MRAIAIAHVVLAHGAMAFLPDLPGFPGRVVWVLIATNFGVPLFFVLSGFLITRQLAAGMPVGTFYRHRMAKIYPMFLVAVVVFGFLGGVSDAWVWLLHLAAVHNGNAGVASRMSGHLWSLAVEIQFYALAPLLFALGYRWLSVRSMAAVAILVWGIHAAYLLVVSPTQAARTDALLNVYQYTSFNIVALLFGALLYRAYAAGERWRSVAFAGALAAFAMPLICALIIPSLRLDSADLARDGHLLALLMLIALPPVASVCLAYLTLQQHWFGGARWRRFAAFVAAISYQWYLWHPLVLLMMQRSAAEWPTFGAWIRAWPWFALAGYGLLSALMGWLAFRWMERPVHQWLLGRARGGGDMTRLPVSG